MHDALIVLFDYYHSITNQRVQLKAILFHGNNNNVFVDYVERQ